MKDLQVFKNNEFGEIRTIQKNNEIWFVVSDICKALELSNPTVTVGRLDDDEVSKFNLGSLSGTVNIVNEYGLYNLILASRKKEAKKFKRWITHEVLPSIRKNGGYIENQENLSDEELLSKALLVATNKINQKNKLIQEMQPKALFADSVSTSTNSILIGELAKLLRKNGYETGQNRLFEDLRNKGYLIKKGENRNLPTQYSMELGLMEIKERTISNADGSVRTTRTPKVTGKGQVYFINKFLKGVA